ncbi:MAG TPA: RNA 2',3'-cyclic phosphodiesterase [Allosphingosinicella sp.]|jgi:2'-5' RNA ligase
MHRLFVAIRPPTEIRERLLDLMEGVDGVRWQDEEQLHLTIRFIGEVDRHAAEDIAAALANLRHPRFDLALDGIGSFDRRGQAATLWAGVAPQEPLKALHKKVDQAVQRAGAAPDRRAYMPHITLARLGRSAGSIRTLLESHGGLSSPRFEVDHFRLYESSLSPKGAVYTIVARYPLD